jgi:hypothetical protein
MPKLISAVYIYAACNTFACALVAWFSFRPLNTEIFSDFVIKLCIVFFTAVILHYGGYFPLVMRVLRKLKEPGMGAKGLPTLSRLRIGMVGDMPVDGEKQAHQSMLLAFIITELVLALWLIVSALSYMVAMPTYFWLVMGAAAILAAVCVLVSGIRLAEFFKKLALNQI